MDLSHEREYVYHSAQHEILEASTNSLPSKGEVGNFCPLCAEPGGKINGIYHPKLLPLLSTDRKTLLNCKSSKNGNSGAKAPKSLLRNVGALYMWSNLSLLWWSCKLYLILVPRKGLWQEGVPNIPTSFGECSFAYSQEVRAFKISKCSQRKFVH